MINLRVSIRIERAPLPHTDSAIRRERIMRGAAEAVVRAELEPGAGGLQRGYQRWKRAEVAWWTTDSSSAGRKIDRSPTDVLRARNRKFLPVRQQFLFGREARPARLLSGRPRRPGEVKARSPRL